MRSEQGGASGTRKEWQEQLVSSGWVRRGSGRLPARVRGNHGHCHPTAARLIMAVVNMRGSFSAGRMRTDLASLVGSGYLGTSTTTSDMLGAAEVYLRCVRPKSVILFDAFGHRRPMVPTVLE